MATKAKSKAEDQGAIDAFFSGGEVPESAEFNKKVLFKVMDVKKVSDYEIFDKEQECIVFYIMDEAKNKSELAQPTNNANGEPVQSLYRPMWWDKKEGKPKPASTMYDLKEAIKDHLGEDLYEKAKEKAGGLNADFFKGKYFEAEVNSGTSKSGDDYFFVKLPSQALISGWKYIVEYKGDVKEYEDLEEVRDAFPNVFDNSKQVEKALAKDDKDNNDEDDPYNTPF